MKAETKTRIKNITKYGFSGIFLTTLGFFIVKFPEIVNFHSELSFAWESLTQEPLNCFTLPGEDTLSIDQFKVDSVKAGLEEGLFRERISGIEEKSGECAGKIDSASMGELYDYACRFHEFEPNTQFVSLLKISLGKDSKGKMCLLYQPMYFVRNGPPKNDTVKYVEGNFNTPQTYFIYDQNKFRMITQKQANEYTEKYKKDIRIRNSWYDVFRGFKWTTDTTKNVEAVIFSFQEIFALIRDNHGVGNSVFISNVAYGPTRKSKRRGKDESKSYYVKHSLILSSKFFPPSNTPKAGFWDRLFNPESLIITDAPLKDKCANMGNRVPPGDVSYKVE